MGRGKRQIKILILTLHVQLIIIIFAYFYPNYMYKDRAPRPEFDNILNNFFAQIHFFYLRMILFCTIKVTMIITY